MNVKTAKRLRRESNYHPSMPRRYVWFEGKKETRVAGRVMYEKTQCLELHEADPRSLYQELKKEYYASLRS